MIPFPLDIMLTQNVRNISNYIPTIKMKCKRAKILKQWIIFKRYPYISIVMIWPQYGCKPETIFYTMSFSYLNFARSCWNSILCLIKTFRIRFDQGMCKYYSFIWEGDICGQVLHVSITSYNNSLENEC